MREYALVFTIAATVTYLLAVVARVVALRVGALAEVRDRDVHAVPIPYLGGIAMLGGLGAAYLVALHLPFLSTADQAVFGDARAVLVGGALMCAVGVLDDIFDLDALAKFGGQLLAAGVVAFLGVQLVYLPLPNGGSLAMDPTQAPLLTVFLIVATVNAVNFVDGLDGLAAGVIGIGAIAFFAYSYLLVVENDQTRALTAALLTAALAGACAGFLPHNFYPARMFMGDSGSMLIGLVLAGGALTLTGQLPPQEVSEGLAGAEAGLQAALLPLLLPVAILMVPFLDLLLAVVRRTRAGRSPFSPDKLHLHHRLLEIGHSHRRAVLLMYTIAGLVAFGTVVVSLVAGWRSLIAVAVLAALTGVAVRWLPRWSS
ncbi:MAG: undecaprenyl/decaprenyl-phosphate alpha-N-acetylglucosaminyl 1-phosphate transferase [Nocardioidaceae bacterium]|nr:undecaprenyl/decaprenyl-phosphate alpha-N-acetylglucosaminyl 1-phosphate transferase [Nocardioidaceae bacterium]MDQ3324288.1 undecaprenyl/decaprenyl-phosphate alpha-N-acetylglucosaminyl 1-phosphate transferase [Actinomycetota bacterium]